MAFWVLDTFIFSTFESKPYYYVQFFLIIPFYLNYFYTVPFVFQKKGVKFKLLWWIILSLSFIITYVLFNYSLAIYLNKEAYFNLYFNIGIGFYICFYYGTISTAFKLMADWTNNKIKNQELLLLKSKTKVKLIKSNINIPFMLKTLTKLETISSNSPKLIEEPIIQLSNLLRHGLYETKESTVPLSKETEVLKEYINLINLTNPKLSIQLQEKNIQFNKSIPPNLLIKLTSIWLEILTNEESENCIFELTEEGNILIFKLPESKNLEVTKSKFIPLFDAFTDEQFLINYTFTNSSIFFKIKNLTL